MALTILNASLYLPSSFSWDTWTCDVSSMASEALRDAELARFYTVSGSRFRFLDRASKMAVGLADKVLSPLSLTSDQRSKIAVCLGVDQATFVSNQEHYNRLQQRQPLSPGIFTNTLPNIPGAMISITQQTHGAQYTFASGAYSFLQALEQASYLLHREPNLIVLAGTIVCHPSLWNLPSPEVGLLLVLQQASENAKTHLDFFWEKAETSLLQEAMDALYLEKTESLPCWAGEGTFAILLASFLRTGGGPFRLGMKQGDWISGLHFSGDPIL